MMRGKWKIKELKIRWFCRNCLQHGIAGITIHPVWIDDGIKPSFLQNPPDVVKIIQTTCHTDCTTPDIRLHYDSKRKISN